MDYPKKRLEWFDSSAAKVTQTVPGWLGGPNLGFGNAGKDSIVGPGRVNFTTSLYKTFAFTERMNFQLRIESFNTFRQSLPRPFPLDAPMNVLCGWRRELGTWIFSPMPRCARRGLSAWVQQ